ncbi:MAG TPA: hypothetical protein VKJ07_19605, partial [Mycobacteriales bacterium]|nr:hypothetical protein [Mycobacteriales bacterium]
MPAELVSLDAAGAAVWPLVDAVGAGLLPSAVAVDADGTAEGVTPGADKSGRTTATICCSNVAIAFLIWSKL